MLRCAPMDRRDSAKAGWTPLIRAAGAGLVATALLSAIVVGCGGKPSSEAPASAANEHAPAATPPTPAETPAAPLTPEELGAKVFTKNCALCHGPDGRGDGPGSVALKPKPRNFHDKAYMSTRTDEQLLEVIHQ